MKMVLKSPNVSATLAEIRIAIAMVKDVNGAWKIMTDQDRFENAESVRDLYRHQGAERERERIIKALEDDGERNYISQETFDYVVSVIKGVTK